jgi:YD repeat-containing protein
MDTIKFGRKNNFFGLMLLVVFLCPLNSLGQAVTLTKSIKPIIYYATTSGITNDPQAVANSWRDLRIANALPNVAVISGIGPCAKGSMSTTYDNIYMWGTPIDWCANIVIKDVSGGLVAAGVEYAATGGYSCPEVSQGSPYIVVSQAEAGLSINHQQSHCDRIEEVPTPACLSCSTKFGNPIDARNSSKFERAVDFDDIHGILSFVRTYDSTSGVFNGNFTYGFTPPIFGAETSSYKAVKTLWSNPQGKYVAFPTYVTEVNIDATKATFIAPAGDRYDFTWNGSRAMSGNSYNKDRLLSLSSGWLLSRLDEDRYYLFDSQGVLQSITTTSGRKVTLSYSTAAMTGITPAAGYLVFATDNFNRSLQFRYDTNGQLSELVDPSGQSIKYVHEATNAGLTNPWSRMLKPIQVTFQDGSFKSYFWDEPSYATWDVGVLQRTNLLTGISDEAGNRFATFTYKNGKSLSTEHGVGIDKYTFVDQRPVPGQGIGTVTITDPIKTSRDMVFNWVNGYPRLISQSQPAGSGCAASSSILSYDVDGNIISEVDFNGNRVCRDVDAVRGLETAHIDGYLSADTCPASVQNAVMPADITKRKTTKQWHPDWNLETRRAEPLKITTWVYNGQPDPTAGNAVANCAPATALLPDGKPIVVLCKQVEQATTDINGQLGLAAVASGAARIWSYAYNQYGQVLNATDPRGGTTVYVYAPITTGDYTAGDLESVTNPAGHTTQYTRYDAHGRPLQIIAPDGLTTDLSYYPRGWLKTTTVTPAGAATGRTTSYTYDLVGQLKTVSFPDATSLSYKYDAAHRLYNIQDNLGNSVTYTLDDAGHRTREAFTDPTGVLVKNMTRVYDALGRAQSVTGAR